MFKSIDTWETYRTEREARNETNDCTVRALASIKGISYDKAHAIMADKAGRQHRQGTVGFLTTKAYESQGLQETSTWKERPTFAKFMRNNPNFTGVIGVRGHVFTVKEGVVYGNWNDASRTRARVLKVYTLAKNGAVMTKELKKGLCNLTIKVERKALKQGQQVLINETMYKIVNGEMTITDKDGISTYVEVSVGMKRFYAAQRRRTKKAKKVQQAQA